MLRQAQIAKYLIALRRSFQDWQKKRHDQLLDITRTRWRCRIFAPKECRQVRRLSKLCGLPRLEAAIRRSGGNQHQFDEAAVLKFLKDPRTSRKSATSPLPIHTG